LGERPAAAHSRPLRSSALSPLSSRPGGGTTSLLTAAADANLQLIKIVTSKLPFDWGSKVESALRIFGADRALLLIEGVAIAKVVMLGFAYPFRRRR